MQIAVIDLGTNTFNLLITSKKDGKLQIICNEKISVKLGRGGIDKNIILPDAIERGLAAIRSYKARLDIENVEKIIAVGTSALRTADNSDDFILQIKKILGVDVEIISGEREAELIYLGVRQTVDQVSNPFLIIDIGGGSNELIIANSEEIIWKESFPLGMARLNEKFKPSNPIKSSEIEALENYFENELQPLFQAIQNINIKFMLGAEGAFETFYNVACYQNNISFELGIGMKAMPLEIKQYHQIHELLIKSTTSERLSMKGLDSFRVEMVVPATIFINYILKKINTQTIFVSPFSLKEGVAWEYFFKD
jgi:exopolyphosphatase / guanosine-5'-triphosphate,3'-diphosphate pyrophosphatase